jgi:hypothetical protein
VQGRPKQITHAAPALPYWCGDHFPRHQKTRANPGEHHERRVSRALVPAQLVSHSMKMASFVSQACGLLPSFPELMLYRASIQSRTPCSAANAHSLLRLQYSLSIDFQFPVVLVSPRFYEYQKTLGSDHLPTRFRRHSILKGELLVWNGGSRQIEPFYKISFDT